jgi:DNA (cytosine-5)-methyltransferase 1
MLVTNYPEMSEDMLQKLIRLSIGKPLRVVDLFAGCGGMSLGFHAAQYALLGGVEFDSKAAQTHAQNFFGAPGTEQFELHSQPRDITQFSPEDFMHEVLGRDDPTGLVDVVVGGPPCQSFARVGRAKLREIMQHPQAFLQDERANLYVNFLEYVEFFRPLAVLMENVPDIMNFGGENVAEEIVASLEELGYRCRYTILNAAHYGVPQMRQRFFLVALWEDLKITPAFPAPTHYIELPQGYEGSRQVALKSINLFTKQTTRYIDPPIPSPDLPPAITAQEALVDLPPITSHLRGEMKRGAKHFNTAVAYRNDVQPSTYILLLKSWKGFEGNGSISDHVTRYLPRDYDLFARMQPGDQYPEVYALALELFEQALDRQEATTGIRPTEGSAEYLSLKAAIVPPYDPGKFPNKWRKMEADQPARTLTAHIGKDTYSHIHYDSLQARVISVREAARLQSFPDGFQFAGPMNTAFRQIGNAVPPLIAYALASQIKQLLLAAFNHLEVSNTPMSINGD